MSEKCEVCGSDCCEGIQNPDKCSEHYNGTINDGMEIEDVRDLQRRLVNLENFQELVIKILEKEGMIEFAKTTDSEEEKKE